jgi:hypothetical protein
MQIRRRDADERENGSEQGNDDDCQPARAVTADSSLVHSSCRAVCAAKAAALAACFSDECASFAFERRFAKILRGASVVAAVFGWNDLC